MRVGCNGFLAGFEIKIQGSVGIGREAEVESRLQEEAKCDLLAGRRSIGLSAVRSVRAPLIFGIFGKVGSRHPCLAQPLASYLASQSRDNFGPLACFDTQINQLHPSFVYSQFYFLTDFLSGQRLGPSFQRNEEQTKRQHDQPSCSFLSSFD